MTSFEPHYKAARALFLEQRHGVLSTISKAVSGYPFGSVVPYSVDQSGSPIILISDIAQHTKNIMADGRVSLTILDHSSDDLQANARLTLLAQAFPPIMMKDEIADRYYRYFPDAKDYHKSHDFRFFRLNLEKIRYIGGFGEIHWLKAKAFSNENPFENDEELRVVNHMNEDHQKALRHYLRAFKDVTVGEDSSVTMTGIDAEGFDVRNGARHYRFNFDEPVETGQQAREALVKMARSGSAAS